MVRNPKLLGETDSLMTAGTGVEGEILLRNRRVGIFVRKDGVDAVTVGADRSQPVAASNSLPVDAGHELLLDFGVAFAAGGGHIELGDGRLAVVRRQDLMGTVAIGANGCL